MARTEVKVGDVGTVYFVPTYDNDLTPANFDPTLASVKQLRFKMPGAAALCVRTGTAAQKTIGGASVWGLEYTVTAADVAAQSSETVGGFHRETGRISIEAYVEFSSSQKWASETVLVDQQGRSLRVAARLIA